MSQYQIWQKWNLRTSRSYQKHRADHMASAQNVKGCSRWRSVWTIIWEIMIAYSNVYFVQWGLEIVMIRCINGIWMKLISKRSITIVWNVIAESSIFSLICKSNTMIKYKEDDKLILCSVNQYLKRTVHN